MTESELREMDAKVAKALGWEKLDLVPPFKIEDVMPHIPHYTTDIAAAWELALYFHNREIPVQIMSDDDGGFEEWRCEIGSPYNDNFRGANADTPQLAICQAFLAVKEGE